MLIKDFEDLFKCFICMDLLAKPLLCPDCSKLACQKWVQSKGECPHCRASITCQQLVKLDWAADVLQVWKQSQVFEQHECINHGLSKDYWCATCKETGCGDCFLLGSDHAQHKISKAQELYNNLIQEEYKSKFIISYHDQREYWVRYVDDLSRRVSEFNLEFLHVCLRLLNQKKKNNEEELFNSLRESDQSIKEYTNSYYENCRKMAQEKILLYTNGLEVGDAFLDSLSVETVLKDPEMHFETASRHIQRFFDDSGAVAPDVGLSLPQPLPYQCIIPEYDSASYQITDFENFVSSGDIRVSQMTRLAGSLWRVKVYTFLNEKTNSIYLSVFVELFQGLSGEFEYKIELLERQDEFNTMPGLSKTYKSTFKESECWGYQKFVKLGDRFNSLYYNETNDSISLTYSIRPTTFFQKCTQLQNYIIELEEKCKISSDYEESMKCESPEITAENISRTIKDIPQESRESQLTLAGEPYVEYSHDILQQIHEIERIVESTSLDDKSPSSPSSSMYESSPEGANSILTRILSDKSKE